MTTCCTFKNKELKDTVQVWEEKRYKIVRHLHESNRGDFKVKIPVACGAY